MPQRQGKRNGVRTNATIRRNEFEHEANRGDFLIDKRSRTPFSLSKSKRWELLDQNEDQPLPIRKQIPMEMISNSRTSPYCRGGYHGGLFHDFDRARQYQRIDGEKSDIRLEMTDTVDAWIDLAFRKHEYPLQRQLHKRHDTPCKCCLRTGGVFVFRGRGRKSSGKTKGMKSYRRKDWQDEFNL